MLSAIGLIAVLSGYFQSPQPDEGSAAHIFQISVVLFVGALLVFLATADWRQPARTARGLIIPASALVLSFVALFCLEHYFYATH